MSSTGPEQPRQPKGSPDARGGQYASYPHGVAGVSLEDTPGHIDIEYPATPPEGTFFFPPKCETAEEIAAFWDYVEVPDAVLQRLRRLWVEAYDEITQAWQRDGFYWDVAAIDFKAANPEPDVTDADAHALWERQRDEMRAASLASLDGWFEQRPHEISRFEVRDVARALGRWSSISMMLPEEASRALSDRVTYHGESMEIREMYRQTGLLCFSDYLTLPDNYDLDAGDAVDQIAVIEEEVAQRVAQEVAERVSRQVAEVVNAKVATTVQQAVSGAESRLAQRVQNEGEQTRSYEERAFNHVGKLIATSTDHIVAQVRR